MNKIIFLILFFTLKFNLHAFAKEIIRYPRPESILDDRAQYPIKLLIEALKESGGDYEILPTDVKMPQSRAFKELENNSNSIVNVVWSMTSNLREEKYLPVRIPIFKGHIGWRLPLVTEANKDIFKHVKSLSDLSVFFAEQGHDWPDTEILQFNKLKVKTLANYEGLFKQLVNNEIDYFPRSIA